MSDTSSASESLSELFAGPMGPGTALPDVLVRTARAEGTRADTLTSVVVTVGGTGTQHENPEVTRELSVGGTPVAIEFRSGSVSGTPGPPVAVAGGLAAGMVATLAGLLVAVGHGRHDREVERVAKSVEHDQRTEELEANRRLLDAVIPGPCRWSSP